MRGIIQKNDSAGLKALGKKISAAREAKRFSKPDLAKAIGVAHVQIGMYEDGINSPTRDNLEKIARALDVSIEYFLNESVKSNAAFAYDKWMQKGREVLAETDQLKVAEYIQLLCMKTESEKMATTYLK